ncbi:MAG: PDGLE domain-containing protein, partial [Desulfuromonadales bacterium]|nr:PDGLE domain-containing protein [Desulfuromonadales bacterium]
MHMADALLSPAVGGTMWVVCAGAIAWCSRRLERSLDDRKVPLMAVLGAFIFAAQMINFTIPATGSSGHLGGGLLLAILLGPCAAFLTIASVLTVQALFFADGGLLALGCNMFNLGVFPCFIGWPIYRRLAGNSPSPSRIVAVALVGGVIAVQLGALAVVVQTVLSGISELPWRPFLLLMQPIHLAIGTLEGVITALVVSFVWRARPELLAAPISPPTTAARRPLLGGLALAAALTGGLLSWFASSQPDGLEWSILQLTGAPELTAPATPLHASLARLQEATSFLPGYQLSPADETISAQAAAPLTASLADPEATAAGLIGGLITLIVTVVTLLSNVESSFNDVWGVKETRPVFRRFADYLSVLLLAPVFLFVAISMTGTLQSHAFMLALMEEAFIGRVVVFLFRVLPFVAMWAAFIFLYIFMPNIK